MLAVAASGLALGLGFSERRRTFAIAGALGAAAAQLGGFVWGESLFVTAGGLVLGAAIAAAISEMLVKVLTGVFDPPPDALACRGATWPRSSRSPSARSGAAGAPRCARCAGRRSRSCAISDPSARNPGHVEGARLVADERTLNEGP